LRYRTCEQIEPGIPAALFQIRFSGAHRRLTAHPQNHRSCCETQAQQEHFKSTIIAFKNKYLKNTTATISRSHLPETGLLSPKTPPDSRHSGNAPNPAS
jgi:hypothetical protein